MSKNDVVEVKLKDAFELQMGKTPARNNSHYWEGNNKWISIADIGKAKKFIFETKEFISDLAIKESGIKIVPKGTVIMSFKLSIGKTAITAEDIYTNEAIMAFIDKGKYEIDVGYLYHYCNGTDWTAGSNKAVMGMTLNKATLSEKGIKIPNIEKQKWITYELDKVDELISIKEEQNDELEHLVKSRFIEMFGDTEHNSKGFPVYKLDKLCKVGSSKRVYQNELSEEGIPFLRIADINNRIDNIKSECELYIPKEKFEEFILKKLVPVKNDILITSRGTLGRCYVVKENDKFYFQDGMISWLSNINEKISSAYISYLFTMEGIKKQISNLQSGSTVAYLSITMLKKLDIITPPIELQQQFADFVEQVEKAKQVIKEQLEELETLKKSLMQKYFG